MYDGALMFYINEPSKESGMLGLEWIGSDM